MSHAIVTSSLRLASLAYREPSEFTAVHPGAVYFDSCAITGEDTQFYFTADNGEILIAFRGSSSRSDFLADADFFLDPVPAAIAATSASEPVLKIHGGFRRQFLAALPTLRKCLQNAPSTWPVRVVGHSLGGALATLCALSLKRGELCIAPRIVTCVTFGSPRVGNAAFARAFDACVNSTIRCVNARDAVTMRPYWGYEHVHGLLQVGSTTVYGFFSSYFGSVKDHSLASYECSVGRLNG